MVHIIEDWQFTVLMKAGCPGSSLPSPRDVCPHFNAQGLWRCYNACHLMCAPGDICPHFNARGCWQCYNEFHQDFCSAHALDSCISTLEASGNATRPASHTVHPVHILTHYNDNVQQLLLLIVIQPFILILVIAIRNLNFQTQHPRWSLHITIDRHCLENCLSSVSDVTPLVCPSDRSILLHLALFQCICTQTLGDMIQLSLGSCCSQLPPFRPRPAEV